jgi:hypothetical protein
MIVSFVRQGPFPDNMTSWLGLCDMDAEIFLALRAVVIGLGMTNACVMVLNGRGRDGLAIPLSTHLAGGWKSSLLSGLCSPHSPCCAGCPKCERERTHRAATG